MVLRSILFMKSKVLSSKEGNYAGKCLEQFFVLLRQKGVGQSKTRYYEEALSVLVFSLFA